ncbi:cupin domain-containing protein [Bacillus paranthracis]|uniref:cupin domain-containing protein n=1 Tax=Bacillus TaxID=1386 RepID=UPI0011A4F15C|nr:cupin domain-containing protein [Bacillus paranthracis]MDK7475250.1 cupin domain-containing protein [Bacillus paranthracis]MEC3524787.1 cupin domain-containing protein [Bacillus paranthracis]NOP82133.1 cupin domain-containing protein [Bacillus paranthracis]
MAEKNAFFESTLVQDFNRDIEQYHLGPLWNAIPDLMKHTPEPHAQAYLWKSELLQKKLTEATQIFTPDRGGERRAIYLQNPGLNYRKPWGWASTTQTLYAAVQLIQPGETAPSHRHVQNALRFVMEGEGAYSIVQGERIFMERGDFLTTPNGLWHGHGHTGDKPMIWMDCLDIPTIYYLGGTFFEPYPEKIEQPNVPDNYTAQRYEGGMVRPVSDRYVMKAPLSSYKWTGTEAALNGLSHFEPDAYDGYAVEYINPSNGETACPTIAAWMQKLPKGFKGKAHRHTHASIYHVHEGSGYTIINGVRFDWSKGDFFVVPNWAWHEHVAIESSYIFSTNDLPILEKFGLERKQEYENNNGYQTITGEFEPALP